MTDNNINEELTNKGLNRSADEQPADISETTPLICHHSQNSQIISTTTTTPNLNRHVQFNKRIRINRNTTTSSTSSISASLKSTSSTNNQRYSNSISTLHYIRPLLNNNHYHNNEQTPLNNKINYSIRILNWEYLRLMFCGNCCESFNYSDEDDLYY